MYKISKGTLSSAHKPFDVVTDDKMNVGFIKEVSCNTCQPEGHQISYSVEWMVGNQHKTAWWDHEELTVHCNIFIKIAETSCHPMSRNSKHVKDLFKEF